MSTICDINNLVIKWNEEKDKWLILNRGVSFKEILDKILGEKYIDILENPHRPGQYIFIVSLKSYVWVVPFIIDKEDSIFLKTAYPSRKFHKIYRGKI